MSNIKSFSDYIKKNNSTEKVETDKGIEIKKDNTQQELSSDINAFSDLETKLEKLKDGEFTIVGIQDVSLEDPTINNPDLKEAMIVNADLGGKDVKRGDIIWITAMIKKNNYNINSMAVIKTRIIDMYNSLSVLNGLK